MGIEAANRGPWTLGRVMPRRFPPRKAYLEIRFPRGRRAAIRRHPAAETPDRSPHMWVLCPEEFGGE